MPSTKSDHPDADVFEIIRDAQIHNRPIVFLIGAGISAGAGIPVTSAIKDYLNQVDLLRNLLGWKSPRDFLLAYGWPKRHELLLQLQTTPDSESGECLGEGRAVQARLRDRRAEFAYEAMLADLRSAHAPAATVFAAERLREKYESAADYNYSDYRALLNYVSGRDPNLVDAFFDRLVRDRPPATAHQFIAFLVQTLRMKLILTTNFDDLLELALREEGEQPVVYELNQHDATMPDPSLVNKHLSVVKLHGGTYGLRAGFDLDRPLDTDVLTTIASYLPDNCLIVALGYSGHDERVMSLVRYVAANAWKKSVVTHKFVWVYREDKIPQSVIQANQYARHFADSSADSAIEPIVPKPYHDGRLFLQELYQRLTFGHAVSQTQYRSILHTPRPFFRARLETKELGDLSKKRVVLFHRIDKNGRGTSSSLAQFTQHLEQTHHRIWIDCSEIRTVASFVDILLEEFRRHDRWLPPVSLPPFVSEIGNQNEAPLKDEDYRKAMDDAIDSITFAMRRARYVIAIDSLGEFASEHPAVQSFDRSDKVTRFIRLAEFLMALIDRQDDFGDSKLCLALSPAPDFENTEHKEVLKLWDDARQGLLDVFDGLRPIKAKLITPDYIDDLTGKSQDQRLIEIRKKNTSEYLVLAVASAFRRPRSFVGLVTICAQLVKSQLRGDHVRDSILAPLNLTNSASELLNEAKVELSDPLGAGVLKPLIDKMTDPELLHCLEQANAVENVIAKQLATLSLRRQEETDQLLVCEEGGFYWMRATHRNNIYEHLYGAALKWTTDHGNSKGEPLADLHNLIADYYHGELFQHSKDVLAYIEYAFHRQQSLGNLTVNNLESHRTWKIKRFRWLVLSVERDLDALLASGRSTALLHRLTRLEIDTGAWLDSLSNFHVTNDHNAMQTKKDVEADLRSLRYRLTRQQAELWRNLTVFSRAARIYLPQCESACTSARSLLKIDDNVDLFEKAIPFLKESTAERDDLFFAGISALTHILELTLEAIVCRDSMFICGPLDNDSQSLSDELRENHILAIEMRKRNTSGLEKLTEWSEALWAALKDRVHKQNSDIYRSAADSACEQLRLSRMRIIYRLIDHHLRWFLPWSKIWVSDPQGSATLPAGLQIDKCIKWFDEWEEFSRSCDTSRRARRFRCYNYTLRARLEYFQRKFLSAERYLRRAKATVSHSHGAPERTAYGVAYLHEAEMHLLHSRVAAKSPNTSGTRQTLLKGALEALDHAYRTMQLGRRDNLWWSIYFILRARIRVDQIATEVSWGFVDIHDRLRRVDATEAFLDGLASIRAARSNLLQNDPRMEVVDRIFNEIRRCWESLKSENKSLQVDWHSMLLRAGFRVDFLQRRLLKDIDTATPVTKVIPEMVEEAKPNAQTSSIKDKPNETRFVGDAVEFDVGEGHSSPEGERSSDETEREDDDRSNDAPPGIAGNDDPPK